MGSSDELRITRDQVAQHLVGNDWQTAANELGISPGLAFMIMSGVPADGSGVPSLDGRLGHDLQLSNPQQLVNPRPHNPTRNPRVEAWVSARAADELTPPQKDSSEREGE